MILEGDTSVIDAIKEKKRLMDVGEPHEHIKPLLIIDGGLMKGAYAAGIGLALYELDQIKTFSSLVGISSGAPTVAYYVSGSVPGSRIIYEECCSKEFFNFWRFGNILNTDVVVDALRPDGAKPVDAKKVLSHKQDLYLGLADFKTAESVLLKPETEGELFAGIRASISMPGLSTSITEVRGRRYVDGAFSTIHPIQTAIETIPASHVLVFTNQDKTTEDIPWLEKFLNKTVLRHRYSPALLKAGNRRRINRHEYIEQLVNDMKKPTCLVWGDGSIGSFERDPIKVKTVVEESKQWWLELLKK